MRDKECTRLVLGPFSRPHKPTTKQRAAFVFGPIPSLISIMAILTRSRQSAASGEAKMSGSSALPLHVIEDDNEATPKSSDADRQTWKLIWGASGIYLAYLTYGHVQEDLFRFQADDGSKFAFAWLLQFCESAANVLVAWAASSVYGGSSGTPLGHFFGSGVSQLFAKAFTSLALSAGLSFPVCTLAKSAKIVPVMLGQFVLGGTLYSLKDYLLAAIIVFGTALLSIGSSDPHRSEGSSSSAGVIFIFISLAADGVTAGLQKRLKHQADQLGLTPTTLDFLLYTNLAMAVTSLAIAIVCGDWIDGWEFLAENPTLKTKVALVCVCSTVGQYFIFYIICQFDALACATLTTTRKILSVVWSIGTKGHQVSPHGGLGLGLAVVGLALEVIGKAMSRRRKRSG